MNNMWIFAPIGGGYIVMSMSVCLSVCMSVHSRITNHTAELCQIFLCMFTVVVGRPSSGSVLIGSGFVDDVIFWHTGASCVFLCCENTAAETSASNPSKFCWTIKISKYTLWLSHRERSLLATTALFSLLLLWRCIIYFAYNTDKVTRIRLLLIKVMHYAAYMIAN